MSAHDGLSTGQDRMGRLYLGGVSPGCGLGLADVSVVRHLVVLLRGLSSQLRGCGCDATSRLRAATWLSGKRWKGRVKM